LDLLDEAFITALLVALCVALRLLRLLDAFVRDQYLFLLVAAHVEAVVDENELFVAV
jgi:hypothetical protein